MCPLPAAGDPADCPWLLDVTVLFRDTDEFSPTVDAAAEKLAISPTAVEKDYWVTQVLRALAEGFVDDFLLKGGTSLSKGFELIERFSEDIDVLILPGDRGRGTTDNLMKNMAEVAAEAVGAELASHGGAETGRHRAYEILYPAAKPATELIQPRVLLEMGVRGGDHPKQWVGMGTLLGDALVEAETDIGMYSDLAEVELWTLHPGRTLLEKLVTVHVEAERLAADGERRADPRIGRHFYDIHQLLGDDEVLALLGDGREVERILGEIADITLQFFVKADEIVEPVPKGGFHTSSAFDAESEVNERLRASYERTMPELYYGAEPLPEWQAIIERVASAPI